MNARCLFVSRSSVYLFRVCACAPGTLALLSRYIKDKDEDLGSRLNLQPKQVRSALAELLAEGFVAKEMMSDEIYSGRSSNYWYIDLRHAVNVILLRVFEMREILSQRQEAKAAHQARRVCVVCFVLSCVGVSCVVSLCCVVLCCVVCCVVCCVRYVFCLASFRVFWHAVPFEVLKNVSEGLFCSVGQMLCCRVPVYQVPGTE